jgi:vancomycin resistance protein YoaR
MAQITRSNRPTHATGFHLAWVALPAALIALPLLLWAYGYVAHPLLPNTRLNGTRVPHGVSLASFVQKRAQLWEGESVTLEVGYHVYRPSRAELGARVDVAATVAALAQLARQRNPVLAWTAWANAYTGSGHDIRLQLDSTGGEALRRYAEFVAEDVNRVPLPGSFDPEGQPLAGIEGESVDVESIKHALRHMVGDNRTHVAVASFVTPAPRVHRTFVANDAQASVLMIAQETEYRASNAGRATNIELAVRLLDGTIVMPGAELSFNRVVGKRDAGRGFASALELLNGELVNGVGGGVCQVAGTLHAAAFFAGLEVLEYRPHSRLNQLAYLRPGLDTMVAWPDSVSELRDTKDMRVRNPYPFPIRVRVFTVPRPGSPNLLRVELYGAARPFRVDWSFEELGRVPFAEVRREDATALRGTERVYQNGLDGLVILRRRTVYMPTRRIEEETRIAYPATSKIVLVGRGGGAPPM